MKTLPRTRRAGEAERYTAMTNGGRARTIYEQSMNEDRVATSKQAALSRILRVIAVRSGKGIMYTAAILGIADLLPGLDLPGVLGTIAGGIGVEALGSLIEHVATNEKTSDDEIKQRVDEVIAQSDIDKLLTKDDFYHAFSHLRKGQKSLSSQIGGVLQALSFLDQSFQYRPAYFDYIQTIPKPPEPYFAHPYPMQVNFTGRVSERKMLTNWLTRYRQPILVLEAIGGMGKSSLVWYWLQNDVNYAALDGVIWWSFYEGEPSFSKFLNETIVYVSGISVDPFSIPTNYDKVRALVNLLKRSHFLLILDGFERQLRAYSGLSAAYKVHETADTLMDARACIDSNASRFLRDLTAGTTQTKALLTTRLAVRDLEDHASNPLDGCLTLELDPLHSDDAVSFMRAQGVTRGTPAEIVNVCRLYGYHPLSLRLLSGLIIRDKRNPGDIASAPHYDVHTNLVAHRRHVLEVAYNALPDELQLLLSKIAAFRGFVSYEVLKVFDEFKEKDAFDTSLDELVERGLAFWDKHRSCLDLHPVVRAYAYDRLLNKRDVHKHLHNYFSAIPVPETLSTMEDLDPIIELIFHSLGAGLFGEAFRAYRLNKMNYCLRYWGQHELVLTLLQPMIEAWRENHWHASTYQRAWLLNERGVQLMFLGRLTEDDEAFTESIKWYSVIGHIV